MNKKNEKNDDEEEEVQDDGIKQLVTGWIPFWPSHSDIFAVRKFQLLP